MLFYILFVIIFSSLPRGVLSKPQDLLLTLESPLGPIDRYIASRPCARVVRLRRPKPLSGGLVAAIDMPERGEAPGRALDRILVSQAMHSSGYSYRQFSWFL